MTRLLMIAAAVVVGTAADAQIAGPATTGQPVNSSVNSTWDQARLGHYHQTLLAIRQEGLRLRAADGGTLTPAHDAYLQAKIDAAAHKLDSQLSKPSSPPLGSLAPR